MDILLTLLSISDAIEDKLDARMKQSFRWRPETAIDRKWDDLQGRFGPEGRFSAPDHIRGLGFSDGDRIESNDEFQ